MVVVTQIDYPCCMNIVNGLYIFLNQPQTCIVRRSSKNTTILFPCKAISRACTSNEKIWLPSCTTIIELIQRIRFLRTLTYIEKVVNTKLISLYETLMLSFTLAVSFTAPLKSVLGVEGEWMPASDTFAFGGLFFL